MKGQLFREDRMPERGVEILRGVAAGLTYKEIGKELGITERAVEGRMGTMREALLENTAGLGMAPGVDALRLVVSRPGAVEKLRQVA